MLVFLFGILVFLLIVTACSVVLGYMLPISRAKRAYVWIPLICFFLYGLLVILEIPIGLLIPFIFAIAVFINISRYVSERFTVPERVRAIAIGLAFIIPFSILLNMGLYGGKYAYPEDERELQMVKAVRRHIKWHGFRPGLRETLLTSLVDIKRRLCGIASVDVQWCFS